MAVNPPEARNVPPVAGCQLAVGAAGVKYANRNDVVLFHFSETTEFAATFTQSAFKAAPVLVAQAHLDAAATRSLLVNSGNANAGTGTQGVASANQCCRAVAEATGQQPESVLPFSTGVIGQALPADKISAAVPALVSSLAGDQWLAAARAIMTTDTFPKLVSRVIEVEGQSCRVNGISKGAGMIRPDMATMLAFVATDAKLDRAVLAQLHDEAVRVSFNRIVVDGDTSTNDACVIAATGRSNFDWAALSPAGKVEFTRQLQGVYTELAQLIVRDGEGATKFITLNISGGRDESECLNVAYAIALSPLVKTALYASDPNWGRILAAVGYAKVEALDVSSVNIWLDDVCVVSCGQTDSTYSEALGQAVFDRAEFSIRVDLGRGDARQTVWTCDLSHEYVTINAEYRT